MDVCHHGADVTGAVGLSAILQVFKGRISKPFKPAQQGWRKPFLWSVYKYLNATVCSPHAPGHQGYLRELLLLQILCDSRFKVLCVTFIQTVNLASLLDLHIPIHQDEFAD